MPQLSVITTRYSVWSGSVALPALLIVIVVEFGAPIEIKSASDGRFRCQSKLGVPTAPVILASKPADPPLQMAWLEGCVVNEIVLGQVCPLTLSSIVSNQKIPTNKCPARFIP